MGGKRIATGRADVAPRDEGPWLGLSAAPQGLGRATVAVRGPLGEERGLKGQPTSKCESPAAAGTSHRTLC